MRDELLARYEAAVARLERAKAEADALAAADPRLADYHNLRFEGVTGTTPDDDARICQVVLAYHFALDEVQRCRASARTAGPALPPRLEAARRPGTPSGGSTSAGRGGLPRGSRSAI